MRTCFDFDCLCDVCCVFVSAGKVDDVCGQGGRLIIIELGPWIILPDRRLGRALYVAPEPVLALLRGERKAGPTRLRDGCVFGDESGPLPPLNLGCVEQSLANGCWFAKAFWWLWFDHFACANGFERMLGV